MAYALAMMVREQRGRATEGYLPCVMYCGPSNLSVNVVLGRYQIYTCQI